MSVDERASSADTGRPPDETSGAGDVSGVPRPPTTGRYIRYLIVLFVVAAVGFIGVGVTSARLNPLVYDHDALVAVARATVVEGKNYANYDPNIDLRALRREQIKLLPRTPDVVVFGGSRWQEFHADLLPGKYVFNAYVSNDQVEDMMAVTYLLDQAGRLPKTLILSERFSTFLPVKARAAANSNDWQVWAPEYQAMAAKLGLDTNSLLDTVPIQRWSGMFYGPAVWDRMEQMRKAGATPHATSDTQTATLDVLGADGSLYWSKANRDKFTPAFVDKLVKAELRRTVNTTPGIDPALVEAMGKTIDYLRSKGVQVYLIQTPYRPDYYAAIQGKPFGNHMHHLETIAVDTATAHGAIAAGTYDPAPFGCTNAEFIDHIHPVPSCLGKVMRQMPELMKG
jgi:hypothetical protein